VSTVTELADGNRFETWLGAANVAAGCSRIEVLSACLFHGEKRCSTNLWRVPGGSRYS
jgi:hypothetical protein